MEKIQEFLEDYEELWQEIAEYDPEYPIMDIWFEKCDDNNFYGINFSGNKSVYPLFFSGSSNYFAAIYVPNNDDLINIEKYPVYIFDIPIIDNKKKLETVGNFKEFIKLVVNDFLQKCGEDNEYIDMAKEVLKKLNEFSDEISNKEPYIPIILFE